MEKEHENYPAIRDGNNVRTFHENAKFGDISKGLPCHADDKSGMSMDKPGHMEDDD